MNYFEFGIYVFSIIIMIATPGPVMILVASVGLQHGYKAAFKTIVGTNLVSDWNLDLASKRDIKHQ